MIDLSIDVENKGVEPLTSCVQSRRSSQLQGNAIPVPDVKGMGLKDAIYAIENNGYKCTYEGIGHVVSQIPSAGKVCAKGETIKLVLK